MSKLYKKYIELKENNQNIYYLFKVGAFYIFLEEDAISISEKLSLKLTHLNEQVLKCGFPLGSLEKYLDLFKNNKIDVKIIDQIEVENKEDYLKNKKILKLLEKINREDINKLNGMKALSLVSELKELL